MATLTENGLTSKPDDRTDNEKMEGGTSLDYFLGQRITLEVNISGSPPPSSPPLFAWRFVEMDDKNQISQAHDLLSEPEFIGQRVNEAGTGTVYAFGWTVERSPQGDQANLAVYWTSSGSAPDIATNGKPDNETDCAILSYCIRTDAPAPLIAKESADAVARGGGLAVSLQREPAPLGSVVDEGLWVRILAVTRGTSFSEYDVHMKTKGLVFNESGTKAYDVLRDLTHDFLKEQCLTDRPRLLAEAMKEANSRLHRSFNGLVSTSLPSVDAVKDRIPLPDDHAFNLPDNGGARRMIFQHTESSATAGPAAVRKEASQIEFERQPNKQQSAASQPQYRRLCLVELIWSYWHEEAMLVQTIKAISRRFQNRMAPGMRDPLQALEIDPLRPLNNLFWGYIQHEQDRISVLRRAHEYEHQYGISLHGKVAQAVRPADRRTKFLESFHNLLFRCLQFYRQDDDKTVSADGFPILNAIKETHYLINHGTHNQFGDLPETDREEKLIEMWLLARPEMRDFLRGRPMIPYREAWMDRVDHMKSLQGWSDVSVVHFHDLAVFGERLLLSVRYGSWADQDDPKTAEAWARFWRQEVQGYVHAYRATTGVDMTVEVTDERALQARNAPPSVHLSRRLAAQGRVRA